VYIYKIGGPGKIGQFQLDQGKLDRFSWTWEKWTGPVGPGKIGQV